MAKMNSQRMLKSEL